MAVAYSKKELREFAERWRGKGYEKGETQQFWLQALRAIGYPHVDDVLFEYHLPSGGFADVWIPDADVLIEQKSFGVSLDDYELRQKKKKTPLMQALDYVEELPRPKQPRFVVTCNFGIFRVYDRDRWSKSQLADNAFEFTLDELAEHPEYLGFITDPGNSRLEKEKQVSIKAGELIGELYDMMREGYIDPDSEESMHALNVLCVRLVFCLYCEDADLFEKDSFYNYLKDVPASQFRTALRRLFVALDTDLKNRDPYDTDVKIFPYVNGGLFREDTEIPNFTEEAKQFLLEKVARPVNWSQISPTIFGGIFESTLNPETRRSGGMHYTSPENIHKVIDPLFLDDLKVEFAAIRDEEGTTPRKKKNALARFHAKLCSLKFFDPACGSGNFLTETYICLRKLEDAVLNALREGQTELGFSDDEDRGLRVSLNQFYGIEINDFAVKVAESALWISRLKANGENLMFYEVGDDDFPLNESARIIEGNALKVDWNDVLPASRCSFVMGNPPFYGGMFMTVEQKNEMKDVFHNLKGVGELDYVTAWYAKGAEYVKDYPIHCCFVSTNSICQGLAVGVFWRYFKQTLGFEIEYAYKTFVWGNEASDQARVHVVIIGFADKRFANKRRWLRSSAGDVLQCEHINGYLMPSVDVYVTEVSNPLSDVPPIRFGSMPRAKGFTLSAADRERFVAENPLCEQWIRPYWGADEFLNRKERYCLWLVDADEDEIAQCPLVVERINRVRDERLASKAPSTRKFADTPTLFAQIAQPVGDGDYLLIPRLSSEKRSYIPIGFVGNEVIASDLAYLVPSASVYHFGVLSSQFHNVWVRMVAGRFKSDYRYAKDLVYNTFIWPTVSEQSRGEIGACAQEILDVRERHRALRLGDLYKRDHMPDDLLAAHMALDVAVERAYGVDFAGDEDKIIAHLFKLYEAAAVGE